MTVSVFTAKELRQPGAAIDKKTALTYLNYIAQAASGMDVLYHPAHYNALVSYINSNIDWKPIESAPKNRHILICGRNEVGPYWLGEGWWDDQLCHDGAWTLGEHDRDGDHLFVLPSHWSELPNFPEEEKYYEAD